MGRNNFDGDKKASGRGSGTFRKTSSARGNSPIKKGNSGPFSKSGSEEPSANARLKPAGSNKKGRDALGARVRLEQERIRFGAVADAVGALSG